MLGRSENDAIADSTEARLHPSKSHGITDAKFFVLNGSFVWKEAEPHLCSIDREIAFLYNVVMIGLANQDILYVSFYARLKRQLTIFHTCRIRISSLSQRISFNYTQLSNLVNDPG